jgi:hypothetical protein
VVGGDDGASLQSEKDHGHPDDHPALTHGPPDVTDKVLLGRFVPHVSLFEVHGTYAYRPLQRFLTPLRTPGLHAGQYAMVHVERHLVLEVPWWKLIEKTDANLVKDDESPVDALVRGPATVDRVSTLGGSQKVSRRTS